MRPITDVLDRLQVPAAEKRGPMRAPFRVPGLQVSSVSEGEPQRDELESFVRASFEARHGARIRSFMPTLLGFRDGAGRLRGVVGLRPAQSGRLYLEQYLDMPVEAALTISGCPAVREDVVEVGNLAVDNCRMAMRIVAELPGHLLAQRYRWIVFTATRTVRGILASFDAPLVELGFATSAQLKVAGDEWGAYYATDPRVLAGYLPDSRHVAAFAAWGRDH